MNTLANHDFVPHNGRNITRDVFIGATNKAINLEPAFGGSIFDNGIRVNPIPNATVCSPRHGPLAKLSPVAWC